MFGSMVDLLGKEKQPLGMATHRKDHMVIQKVETVVQEGDCRFRNEILELLRLVDFQGTSTIFSPTIGNS